MWLLLVIGVPLVALIGIAPWLLNTRDLFGSDIVSPFERSADHWQVMILYHGIWSLPVAIIGAIKGLRGRDQLTILAVVWLILVLDFSTTGILETLVPWLVAPVLRYDYPFSIAWHGPIIPYTILAGQGLLWLWERFAEARYGGLLERRATQVLAGISVLLLIGMVIHEPLLLLSKDKIGFFGAFSSRADIAAMNWLKDNTPPETRVLNHPGPHEADWVPVISERDSIYFRPQPFFRGAEASEAEQQTLLAFWQDPADPANAALLTDAGVSYVIVPQIVTNPASIESMFRWRAPFTELTEMDSQVAEAPYLELVFDESGAQVYQLKQD
jgi:hypothetical protein